MLVLITVDRPLYLSETNEVAYVNKRTRFYLLVDVSHPKFTSEIYTSDLPLRKEPTSSCVLLATKRMWTAAVE